MCYNLLTLPFVVFELASESPFELTPVNFWHVPISLWTLSYFVTQSSSPKNKDSFYSIICVIHRRFLTDWILSGSLKGITIIPLQNAMNSVTSLLEIFLIIYVSRMAHSSFPGTDGLPFRICHPMFIKSFHFKMEAASNVTFIKILLHILKINFKNVQVIRLHNGIQCTFI